MLDSYRDIFGKSILYTMCFCASLMMLISFFRIATPYSQVLTAKALSLAILAVSSRSEALRAYFKLHGTNDAPTIYRLDQFGAILAVAAVVLLVFKVNSIETDLPTMIEQTESSIPAAIIRLLQANSEIVSIVPLFFFALTNLCTWYAIDDDNNLGRVSFVLSDMPVLIPILAAGLLTSLFGGGYGTDEFKLLFGGATVMLILVSIILNCCVESLLDSRDSESD